MKRTFILAIAAVCNLANAAVLFDNGPVVNAQKKSVIAVGETTTGLGANGPLYVADDFSIEAGKSWNVTSIDFFAYQTNAAGFTFGNANWSIVKDDVNGAVVASGTTAVTNGGLVGYRVSSSQQNATTRPIYDLNADIADQKLDAGNYWLRWNLTGTLSSGPWVAVTSDNRPGNAAQKTSVNGIFNTWQESSTKRKHDLPFVLNGNVVAVPEPQTYALMLGGLALLAGAARRRGSKQA
ncbi:PEP-CTERM sorting domain-containing protein [Paucibacter sp. TC2R-5]|uniref:PEP-CTERM sorting domain-containing protein n=1 Tax=Paucibacter sp. TC2R-5 TaxID=2893555 RepID=UPI0021E424D6|nr:PEP-CTERM sorting domain-containing protein [Paucibacter sp. TC2R-5]MCV2359346.1 PEP-CTERM sorting domain-containing protein [Paucibacter sp. TC2R-5]